MSTRSLVEKKPHEKNRQLRWLPPPSKGRGLSLVFNVVSNLYKITENAVWKQSWHSSPLTKYSSVVKSAINLLDFYLTKTWVWVSIAGLYCRKNHKEVLFKLALFVTFSGWQFCTTMYFAVLCLSLTVIRPETTFWLLTGMLWLLSLYLRTYSGGSKKHHRYLNPSLRTADAFPVVTSLPPKNSYFSEREKRRPEMRLWFTGYLNPGMPAKLNSSQLCKQARLIVALSPTGGTITKTLFICRLFQWLMGLIQKWNALPQVMSHFQMLLGLAGLILIHPTDWLRRCPFIWEYTLVATRNIAGPLACLWSWTSQLCK